VKFTSELRDATCQWDHHTVLSATRQRWPPRLHPNRRNRAGWYSIYRPRKDERLSWPSWLVTYRNGLPVHRRSPIRVLTGSDVAQLLWSKPTRYHYKSNRQDRSWSTIYMIQCETYRSQFPTAFESMLLLHEHGRHGRRLPWLASGSPKYPSLQYWHRWPVHMHH